MFGKLRQVKSLSVRGKQYIKIESQTKKYLTILTFAVGDSSARSKKLGTARNLQKSIADSKMRMSVATSCRFLNDITLRQQMC